MNKTSHNGQKPVGNERFEGFVVDLMKEIGAELNIEYEFDLVKDKQFGSEQPDGSWDGMVGEVMREVCPFLI